MSLRAIKDIISEALQVKMTLLSDAALLAEVNEIVRAIVMTYRGGGKVLFCGNGGSAGDAQHLAGELSGRFLMERDPLFAEALHVNTSFLTAVSNDYGFDEAYARMVLAAGDAGDVLIALSTSGNSPNILAAANSARETGMQVFGMTGKTGGKLLPLCDRILRVPSTHTPRIQEVHILLGHVICELVEKELFA